MNKERIKNLTHPVRLFNECLKEYCIKSTSEKLLKKAKLPDGKISDDRVKGYAILSICVLGRTTGINAKYMPEIILIRQLAGDLKDACLKELKTKSLGQEDVSRGIKFFEGKGVGFEKAIEQIGSAIKDQARAKKQTKPEKSAESERKSAPTVDVRETMLQKVTRKERPMPASYLERTVSTEQLHLPGFSSALEKVKPTPSRRKHFSNYQMQHDSGCSPTR